MLDLSSYTDITAQAALIIVFIGISRWMMGSFTQKQNEIRTRQESMMEEITNDHRKHMEMIIEHHTLNSMILTSLQELIIRHDATVRGVNPSTGDTSEERVRDAISIYELTIKKLNDIASRLEELRRTKAA